MSDCTSRRRIARTAVLRIEERLVPHYCWDMAWCDCPPALIYNGVPCVSVGLTVHRERGRKGTRIARCLACETRWLEPERRRADRMSGGAR